MIRSPFRGFPDASLLFEILNSVSDTATINLLGRHDNNAAQEHRSCTTQLYTVPARDAPD